MRYALLGILAVLAPYGGAQTCTSTLGATWDPATSALSITLAGAPANAPTMTFVSLNQGTTTMHGVSLGLARPFYTMFFGIADASGNLGASVTLSPAPTGMTAYLQSVSMDMTNHMPAGGSHGGMGIGRHRGTGGGTGGGSPGGGMHGGSGGCLNGGSGPGTGVGPGSMGMTFCLSNVVSVQFP